MPLLSILILLQVFSKTFSLELDDEGNALSNSMLQSLADLTASDELLDDSYIPADIAPLNSIEKFGKDFMSIPILKETEENKTDELKEYLDHLKKRGAKLLKYTTISISKPKDVEMSFPQKRTGYISNDTNMQEKEVRDIKKNMARKINLLAASYMTSLQNHFNSLILMQKQYNIDVDYVFLDMLETATRLLQHKQKKIIDDVIVKDFITTYLATNYTFHDNLVNLKRDEFRYICNHHEVCIPYSAWASYFERLLNTILVLPGPQYKEVFDLLGSLIVTDLDLETLLENNERTSRALTEFLENPQQSKLYLEVARGLLSQRYKIIQSKDIQLKLRIQSLRMLLDILDNEYYCNDDDNLINLFNGTLIAIKDIKRTSNDFYALKNVADLISYIFKSINSSRDPRSRVLIEALIRGEIPFQKLYYTVFRDGAKGVYTQ